MLNDIRTTSDIQATITSIHKQKFFIDVFPTTCETTEISKHYSRHCGVPYPECLAPKCSIAVVSFTGHKRSGGKCRLVV